MKWMFFPFFYSRVVEQLKSLLGLISKVPANNGIIESRTSSTIVGKVNPTVVGGKNKKYAERRTANRGSVFFILKMEKFCRGLAPSTLMPKLNYLPPSAIYVFVFLVCLRFFLFDCVGLDMQTKDSENIDKNKNNFKLATS